MDGRRNGSSDGYGTTLFNEKVKKYTGFSPFNYLINIRISEAIKLLKNQDVSITDIALTWAFIHHNIFQQHLKNSPAIRQVNSEKNIFIK